MGGSWNEIFFRFVFSQKLGILPTKKIFALRARNLLRRALRCEDYYSLRVLPKKRIFCNEWPFYGFASCVNQKWGFQIGLGAECGTDCKGIWGRLHLHYVFSFDIVYSFLECINFNSVYYLCFIMNYIVVGLQLHEWSCSNTLWRPRLEKASSSLFLLL